MNHYGHIAALVFFVIWGGYERLSAMRTARPAGLRDEADRFSLLALYGAIWAGGAAAFTLAFTGLGDMALPFPIMTITGFAVVAGGLALRLKAKAELSRHFTYTVTIVDGHELITTGLYARMRHPSYTGQWLVFLGLGMALANWLSIAAFCIPTLAATIYRIRVEEAALAAHFGEQYRAYRERTPMVAPRIGRGRS